MKIIKRVPITVSVLVLGFSGIAASQALDINIPASFVPSELDNILSNLGTVGNLPLQNIDKVPGIDAAVENAGNVVSGGEGQEAAVASVESAVTAVLSDELSVDQGIVVPAAGLTQVVTSGQITSSVSGNRVEVAEAGSVENSVVDSFNNLQIPFTHSQNVGHASIVNQSIVVQVGIDTPVAITQ